MINKLNTVGELIESLKGYDPNTPLFPKIKVFAHVMHKIVHDEDDIDYRYCFAESDPDKSKSYGCCEIAKQYNSTEKVIVISLK